MAFYDLLTNLGIITRIFKDAADSNKFTELTKGKFICYPIFPLINLMTLGNLAQRYLRQTFVDTLLHRIDIQ